MTADLTVAAPAQGVGRAMSADVRRVAFFDVDETLLRAKSMLSFWDHWKATAGQAARAAEAACDLGQLARMGADRAELNRAYYRRFAGVPLARVQEAGRRWYAVRRTDPAGFVAAGMSALLRHRAAGDAVVLVSGSCAALLDPLARDLDAELVLCTEQLVGDDGVLTGEVQVPMVGEAKAEAATGLLAALGIDPADCFAYGDHSSDLALLRAIGRPVVVGEDLVLTGQVRALGWPQLSAAPGPLRVAGRRREHHSSEWKFRNIPSEGYLS